VRSATLDKTLRFLAIVFALAMAFLLLYRFSTLAIYAGVAVIVAYLLDPIVNRMQSSGLNRTFSILMVITGLILILYFLSTNLFPPIIEQVATLGNQLNADNINMIARTIDDWVVKNVPFGVEAGVVTRAVIQFINELFQLGNFQNTFSIFFGNIFGLVGNLFTAIIVIPLSIFFLLKDGSKIRRSVLSLVPNKYFETIMSIIDKTEKRLGIYFKSVILQSLIVALLSSTLLTLIGFNNAIIVGLFIGLANTIPYFGPAIGYIIIVLVAIFERGDLSLVYPGLLAQLTTQLVDNVILQPLIFSKSADMHPLSILFIVFIGAEVGGVLGMLIAIPIAATVNLTIKEVYWSLNNYHVFRLNRK
jgi:predicted PurR-regulated permease PerM